ncbi:MAG: UbiA-like polyprenyltransferase [Longimicrobiales bacterium]
MVRLPHTLFALPFAGVGVVLGTRAAPGRFGWWVVVWVVIGFTAARFAAMAFNRIVDRSYDALNPRTAGREIPSGRLTAGQAAVSVAIASAVFIAAAWQLNPLCGLLAPIALAWVLLYSYTKRFTSLAHLVLGLGLGIAPVGGYLAVTGAWSEPWFALVLLAFAVMLWVAGFDVIYSLQDVPFDRVQGLHSIPARVGIAWALRIARLFHALAVVLLGTLWVLGWLDLGWLFLAAVALMAATLHLGHTHVGSPTASDLDIARIDRAFFRTNVIVSSSFFALTLLDRLLIG